MPLTTFTQRVNSKVGSIKLRGLIENFGESHILEIRKKAQLFFHNLPAGEAEGLGVPFSAISYFSLFLLVNWEMRSLARDGSGELNSWFLNSEEDVLSVLLPRGLKEEALINFFGNPWRRSGHAFQMRLKRKKPFTGRRRSRISLSSSLAKFVDFLFSSALLRK